MPVGGKSVNWLAKLWEILQIEPRRSLERAVCRFILEIHSQCSARLPQDQINRWRHYGAPAEILPNDLVINDLLEKLTGRKDVMEIHLNSYKED